MNSNLSSALRIIFEIEVARRDGRRKVCALLSLEPTSKIARILVENDNELKNQHSQALLEEVLRIVGTHRIQRNITEWPFENFWGNPYEPYHSKLLAYFIDRKEHECGDFLLAKLLELLESSLKASKDVHPAPSRFVADDCDIHAESGYIDLCIEHRNDPKYAIIVENKINGAKNQDEQLQTYVRRVSNRGFDYKQIYVFYLPLTNDKDPDLFDQAWVEKNSHYKKITFEEHILDWLNGILQKNCEDECPKGVHEGMRKGMRDNLCHYRNLISYLIQKQKEIAMDSKILERIKLADDKHELPALSDIEDLKTSAEWLLLGTRHVLRGKLILQIQSILQKKGETVWLCLEKKPDEKITDASEYDKHVKDDVNLCVYANDSVSVCIGGQQEDNRFWLGYMRNGSEAKQEKLAQFILSEAEERLKKIDGKNAPWYAWRWIDVTYTDCMTNSSILAEEYAKKLLAMRIGVVDRITQRGKGVRAI